MENKRNSLGEPINPAKNTNLKYIEQRARDALNTVDATIATNDTNYCLEAVELMTEALERIEKIAADALEIDI